MRSTICLEKQFYIFIGELLPINREMMPWKSQIGSLHAGMVSCPTGTIKVSSHVGAAGAEAGAFWPRAVRGPRVPAAAFHSCPGRSETHQVPNQKLHPPVGVEGAPGKGVPWVLPPSPGGPGGLCPASIVPLRRPYRSPHSSTGKCLSSSPAVSHVPRTLCRADAIIFLNNYLITGL